MFIEFGKVDIDRNEVIKQLSNGRVKKQPSADLLYKIEDWIIHCEQILHPHGVYDIFERVQLPDKPYFNEAIRVGMGICTIGTQLPILSESLINEGNLADGVIVDAIGSVAADAVADLLNDLVNRQAESMDLIPSMRYSPGYCDMGIEDQRLIFDVLHDHRLGVKLTQSCMMFPIKSVSFAVNLGLEFINRCSNCQKNANCPHRR